MKGEPLVNICKWGYHPILNKRFLWAHLVKRWRTFSSPRGKTLDLRKLALLGGSSLNPLSGGSTFSLTIPKKVKFSQNWRIQDLEVLGWNMCVSEMFTQQKLGKESLSTILNLPVFESCCFSLQVCESHPYRHPSLPREKKVWLDPSNTGGMTGCVGNSHIVIKLKKSCGSKGSHSLKCETQESLSQMLFLHQGRMFSFGNPSEIVPVFVYILCWWICKMFRGLFPKQELGFGLLMFI